MQATVYMIAGYFCLVHAVIYDCVETAWARNIYYFTIIAKLWKNFQPFQRLAKFQTVHNSRFEAFP